MAASIRWRRYASLEYARAPRLAWMITGASVRLAAAITACTCSMLFTLKAATP